MEPENESRPRYHWLALYPQTGTLEVRLYKKPDYAVRDLARVALPTRIVATIADHGKWSHIYSVRLALLRNSQAPMARVLMFLPSIQTTDLKILSQSSSVPSRLLPHIRRELANRMQHGKSAVRGT